MATGVTVPADSQPAKSSSEILSSMDEKQTLEWRTTGKLPEQKDSKTEAVSSPAAKETPEAPAKATETPAGSVPATKEPPKEAKGAEGRIKELLADNKRLKAELETLQKAPAAAPAKKDETLAKPQRTDVDAKTGQLLYANDEAFEQAREEWLTKKITADRQGRRRGARCRAKQAHREKLE
jgi:hypothetical protein